jgi:predicted helicase
VKTFADFRAFSQAGRDLAHWHLSYETVACHPGVAVVIGKEQGPYYPFFIRFDGEKRRQ